LPKIAFSLFLTSLSTRHPKRQSDEGLDQEWPNYIPRIVERPQSRPTACDTCRAELWQQEDFRQLIEQYAWAILSILDPTLEPWDTLAEIPRETIKRVEVMGCFALHRDMFAAKSYDRSVWCRHHAQVERPSLPLARLLGVALTRDQETMTALLEGGWRLEASHTCHSAGCGNPTHIALESSKMNGKRNQCLTS
jgi:hypothetical protein